MNFSPDGSALSALDEKSYKLFCVFTTATYAENQQHNYANNMWTQSEYMLSMKIDVFYSTTGHKNHT